MLRLGFFSFILASMLCFAACNSGSNQQEDSSALSKVDSIAHTENNPASRDLQSTTDAIPDSAISELLNIQESGGEIRMLILNELLFEENTANIMPDAELALEQAAAMLNSKATGKVMITGHSGVEDDADTQTLSKERAKAVFDFLQAQTLKESLSLQYQGVGNRYPMLANENEDGTPNELNRRKNQRVEIVARMVSK